MTDKPTPTTDLLKRGVEIHEGRSTGVLSGEALRDYAKRKWPGRRDTLQMAEHETGTEALALLAKWGQPDQAQADSVLYDPKAVLDVFNSARAGSEKPVGYLRGILAVIAHWESRPEPHRWLVPAQPDSVPAVSDLPPLPAPDLRDVGRKPQEIKEFLKGYATEYARTAIAASAPADSVLEDAALWHWLAEYLVGTRTDLDDEIVASETVNDLRKLVEAAIKQGATK